MSSKTELSYTQAVRRIEEIIDQLKGQNIDIDAMLELVEEAAKHIEDCRTKLSNADIKIKAVLSSMDDKMQHKTVSETEGDKNIF